MRDFLAWLAARFAENGECWRDVRVPHPYEGAPVWVCGAVNLGALCGAVLAIVTIAVVAKVLWDLRWPGVRPPDGAIMTLAVLTFVWAILPPVWFWYEHWFLYTAHGCKDAFAQFRHNQQLSAAIWAGLLASSAVVLGRAQARDRQEAKPTDETGPAYAIFGSFQKDPIASAGPSALIWTDTAEPDVKTMNDLKAKSPFPFLHIVERSPVADDTTTWTRVRTLKDGPF